MSSLSTIPVVGLLFYSWFTTIPMKKTGAFEALVKPNKEWFLLFIFPVD